MRRPGLWRARIAVGMTMTALAFEVTGGWEGATG